MRLTPQDQLQTLMANANKPSTCRAMFLIRTHKEHFETSQVFNIMTLINSLRSLNNPHWSASIINIDEESVNTKDHPLAALMLRDDRIRLISMPRSSQELLIDDFELVDRAISAFQSSVPATWLIVCNGNDYYDKKFLDSIDEPPDLAINESRPEVLVVGHWSGDHPMLNGSLSPLELSPSQCYHSGDSHEFAELGALILRWSKLSSEQVKFAHFSHGNREVELIKAILSRGFNVKIINECLYSKAPNPFMCSRLGGVWWASAATVPDFGKSCLLAVEAALLAKTTFPEPVLSRAPSGAKILMLPEPYHSIAAESLEVERAEANREHEKQLREFRERLLCPYLRRRSWRPNWIAYRMLNRDLSAFETSQLEDHFWAYGCSEGRILSDPPLEYFALPTETSHRRLRH